MWNTTVPYPTVGRVDRDTTFYVGTLEGNPGGHIAVLTTGLLDKSTASVLIEYTKPPATATDCKLPTGGPVDCVYGVISTIAGPK